MNKLLLAAALSTTLTAGLTAPALAGQAGDFFARVGVANVAPNESSDVVADTAELSIAGDTQLGLTLTYMLTDNWAVELLAATPFTHDVSVAGLGQVAEVTHLPPTLLAQYYFGDASAEFRPYVGAGLNYTVFFEEEGVGALDGTEVKVDNSFGYALQAGFDYKLNDQWSANAAVWYINIETDVHTAVGTVDTKINPTVAMLGLKYQF
ncbi:OmpW family outer membrane protein [Catenovulum sp. SX2]|uniref:OmpW family outer membrane protein n=1 Tax=Catenovulum sp. SX2 TaxID=3398614 RepID=UPI003F82F887